MPEKTGTQGALVRQAGGYKTLKKYIDAVNVIRVLCGKKPFPYAYDYETLLHETSKKATKTV
ncbi:MAG: hypothetical protein FWD71_17045 [Oscillospiraceae bacterium]|nr:hypothetical protein [Oscillospiraceae bacterium]